jgi:cell division protein FtsB
LRRWWVLAVLLLAFAALQAKLWWGEGGLGEARELDLRVSEQRAENARLQQRNDALSAEVEDLKSGEAAVEDRARSELGMIKPGETFYRVVEPAKASPPGGEPAPETDADAPEPRP